MMSASNQQQQQQFFQAPMMGTYEFNPKSIVESEQFPDILNYLNNEQIRAIFELLAQPANAHLVNKTGPLGGYTALHWMAIKNELELLQFLVVRCRADVNCQAKLGETPLFICIKNCNLYTIEFLIEHGASLELRDNYNRSVVHWAAYTGKTVLLYYFQKYHSITNFNEPDQFKQNALHIACGSGFSDMIKFLLDRGSVDVFAQDFNGNTCLHLAAKCGLAKMCWLITREKKGEAAKLVMVKNNSDQTPYEFIRNERSPNFRKIKNWLRLEAKTNKWILNQSTPLISKFWNSTIEMKGERILRFAAFFLVLTIPAVINTFLVYPGEMSLLKGLVGYSTFVFMTLVIVKQKHRINHISGLQNPFFLGYFSCLFVHNYFAYYSYLIGDAGTLSLFKLIVMCLTCWHFYTYYKIVTVNPGFCKESVKKKDGTAYDLRDLLQLNANSQKSYRDSINLITEPSSTASMDGGETNPLFLCEHCLLVQSIPTKHCKLCEACCSKFDHHCLYICSCVGLKNHRPFIYFLISSITCTSIYLQSLYSFFVNYSAELDAFNTNKPIDEQITFFYALFASSFHIWLMILLIVNSFSMIMVLFLILYQFKFISLGFTSQFPPPIGFIKNHKRMSTILSACMHRIDNLYTFFFDSCESNQELYYKQQSEYRQSVGSNKAIPLSYYPYPKNNFVVENNNATPTTINMMSDPIDPNYQRNMTISSEKSSKANLLKNADHYEIDLD